MSQPSPADCSRSASSVPLEVHVDGEPLRVDTRKALAIVALLAVERRPYAREELAAMFWPESDDESARGALRRTLSVLRTALGDRWLRVDRATVALAEHGAGSVARPCRPRRRSVRRTIRRRSPRPRPSPAGRSSPASRSVTARTSTTGGRPVRSTVERRVVDVLERLVAAAEAAGDPAAAVAAAHAAAWSWTRSTSPRDGG